MVFPPTGLALTHKPDLLAELAKRPDQGGTAGRKIPLSVNLYRLKFRSSASIAHYDVNIVRIRAKEDPSKPAPAINRDLHRCVGRSRRG